MKKYGLIGYPIAHSLSPSLFKAAYNGKYPYDLIEIEDFETAYQKFIDEYAVINVTAPFKDLAYDKADILTDDCKGIGAANILIKGEDGKITAANSDHIGVTGAINAHIDGLRRTALIVGCGGAAKAAAYAMCKAGFSTTIINRSIEKAEIYAHRLTTILSLDVSTAPMTEFGRLFKEAGVIIYNLPLHISALDELTDEEIKGSESAVCKKVVLEANYKDPSFTEEYISKLKSLNPDIVYISGKEWLLHQAVGAYKSFTGEEPNIELMRKVL